MFKRLTKNLLETIEPKKSVISRTNKTKKTITNNKVTNKKKLERKIYSNDEESQLNIKMSNNYENFLEKQPNVYSGPLYKVYFNTRGLRKTNLNGANKRHKLTRKNQINKKIIDDIKKIVSQYVSEDKIEETTIKYFNKIVRFCQVTDRRVSKFDECRKDINWLKLIEDDLKQQQ